tara:strand:+ start:17589 stop:17924 length:336 start_codon:yes stop_codon:yes gene_type:complete
MIGLFKAKDSYKNLTDDESLKYLCESKHKELLNGNSIMMNSKPLGMDFSSHLEKIDNEVGVQEGEVESNEPSDDWTKEALKEYMIDNNISFNSGDTKQDLLDKIKASKGDG